MPESSAISPQRARAVEEPSFSDLPHVS